MALLTGCWAPPPQFRLNTEGRDAHQITAAQQEAITGNLKKLFGTPDEPVALDQTNLDGRLLAMAAGPIGRDASGNRRGLYRQHCARCHGISGDGAGPAAAMLNPYPRDFRNGVFKFTSTAGGAKPVAEDLRHNLQQGNCGTAMPSFGALTAQEIDALIEYVRYLSLRGETERYLLQLVVDEDEYPVRVEYAIEDGLMPAVEAWARAPQMAVDAQQARQQQPPLDTPEAFARSVTRGQQLYANKNARCIECHGPEGKGDGSPTELYDDWNKPKQGATPEQTAQLAHRFRLPIQEILPRNFTEGTFLGGDRPIDLYWRIHVSIKGTPMPAAGPAPGSKGVLTSEQIWDVVCYVFSRAGRGPEVFAVPRPLK